MNVAAKVSDYEFRKTCRALVWRQKAQSSGNFAQHIRKEATRLTKYYTFPYAVCGR